MKKLILGILGLLFILLIISSIVSLAMADTLEVTPEGTSTDIRYFDGSVGIGTSTPATTFEVSTFNVNASSGNVGIGTASPQTSLQITGANTANRGQLSVVGAGGAGAQITFYSDPTFAASISGNSNAMSLVTLGNWPIIFYPNNAEAMRLTSGGNVGIGTTEPNQALTVAGNVNITGTYYGDGSGLTGIGEVVNVKEFGAKGDGSTDDTAAFNAALVEANKTKPLFLPPGNYVISNLVLQGTSSGGAEEGKAFGLIGSGVGTTTITATGGSGVFIQVGASTDPAVGYRRFVMRDLKIAGNSGYSEGIQIGNYNGGSPVIILGEMRNIETTGFSAENASGLFLQNAVSFNINNLYSYSNYFGIKIGSVTGVGEITTINIQNSQFRINTYGAAIFQANGVNTYNNVYEANNQWGMIIKSFTGFTANTNHLFMRDWFEANTVGGVLITSNSPPSVTSPQNIRFVNGVFTKGTDRAIRIQDGSDITFIGSHMVGSTPKITVEQSVPRVNFQDGFFAGASAFSVSDYNDLTNEWRPLYVQDVSGAIAGRYLRGTLEIDPVTSSYGTGLRINSKDYGTAVRGPSITVGRNSYAANPSAGTIIYTAKDGTVYYTWVDATGRWRIYTNGPPSISDTGGNAVITTGNLADITSVGTLSSLTVSGDTTIGGRLNVSGETRLGGVSGDAATKVVCVKSNGDLGTCSNSVNTQGKCTTCA